MSRTCLSVLLALFAGPALGERIACTLSEPCASQVPCPQPVNLSFIIDRNQFSAAVHPNDPPRKQVTMVDLGGIRFAAEPMIIGKTRGFWEDGEAMGARIFTMQPDGSGIYNETATGRQLAGPCTVTQ